MWRIYCHIMRHAAGILSIILCKEKHCWLQSTALDFQCLLSHLVMHLAREILQLLPGIVQGLLLHVVWGCVGQELVQGDDVPGYLVVVWC